MNAYQRRKNRRLVSIIRQDLADAEMLYAIGHGYGVTDAANAQMLRAMNWRQRATAAVALLIGVYPF